MTIGRILLVVVPAVALFMGACNGNSDDSEERGDRERCNDFCETVADCDEYDLNANDCIDACVDDARSAGDSCAESFEDMADCTDDANKSCDAAGSECEDQLDDFADDCQAYFADTFDVLADAIVVSCNNTCAYSYDGFCDEPNLCPIGTDGYDCGC